MCESPQIKIKKKTKQLLFLDAVSVYFLPHTPKPQASVFSKL